MFEKGPAGAPRHMAGTKRAPRPVPPAAAAPISLTVELATDEVAPVARVHRSRLAFAMSATVAALPLLVIDNLPATADPGERTEVAAIADAGRDASLDVPSSSVVVETTVPTTVTTAAPEPTDAPTADSEPDAPATTEAIESPEVSTLQAAPAAPVRQAPAPTTTTAPPPAASAAPAPSSNGDPNDPATWDRLAQCESQGRWDLNSGNGYYGGLQFSLATWQDVGGAGYPHQASREEQIRRGQMLQARYGWGQWPHCSRELGYR